MPTLRKLCNHPGCSNDAITRHDFCAAHKAAREASRQKRKDRGRASAAARGYDAKWRRVRAMYLRRHPVCVGDDCGRPAEEVDHILPLADGGTHKWENLQALCKSCHSKKTIRDNRGKAGKIKKRKHA